PLFPRARPGERRQNNYRNQQQRSVMYAVIVTGGKQYRVMEGETLRVEKLDAEPGSTIEFGQVLLLGNGEQVTVGSPAVDGARVTATVKGHGRHEKIRIIKFQIGRASCRSRVSI